MRPGLEQRIDEALAAGRRADHAQAAGDSDRAVAHHRQAERLLEALVADDPDEPAHLQALGARRYSAGEAHLARGDPDAAASVLGRAVEAYQALAALGGGPDELGLMIADVRMRRARCLVQQGRHASALAESQAGAFAYLRQWDGSAHHPQALDTARILAWHAFVTSRSGDPDLAVAAADTALRVYLARAADVNGSPELRAVHLPRFVLAAQVAAVIHDAHDRPDLSATAAEIGEMAIPPPVGVDELPKPRDVRAAGTLAQAMALAEADDELRDQLTAPAVDCRLLISADRCAPELAPTRARQLAALAERVPNDLAALLRLSLEGHALFAHASEVEVPSMRYDFGRWGAAWADLTRRASQACHAAGVAELADDFGDWMVGALELLTPHVLIDPEARATARRCTIWQGEYAAAIGNEEGTRAARASLDHLETLDTLGPIDSPQRDRDQGP